MDIPDTPPPSHHANDTATSFRNPWPPKSLLASHQVFSQWPIAIAKRMEGYVRDIKVIEPDFARDSSDEGVIKATWLGHAGFLVQLPRLPGLQPVRVLFDPMWSERASPSQYTGPRRRLPPPCELKDLPDFQFVVTSHNHYDHLDWPTIHHIHKLKGTNVTFLAPLGNEAWFMSCGIPHKQIVQLDWNDTIELSPRSSTPNLYPKVKFICTPAQHSSGRGVFDQHSTLWSSWVVEQTSEAGRASVYHAGDTGYMTHEGPCPAFKEIGTKYGPFDLALLPIWRGSSLSFLSTLGLRLATTELLDGLHASPAHAVSLFRDVRARHGIGMHFATFAGSSEEAKEAVAELAAACEQEGVPNRVDDEGGFGVVDVGQTIVITVEGGSDGSAETEPTEG